MFGGIGKLLKGLAPVLGGAVGGPLGGLAMQAAARGAAAGGTVCLPRTEAADGSPKPVKVLEKLLQPALENITPAGLEKLQSANSEFMLKHKERMAELENADRAGARSLGEKHGIWPAYSLTIISWSMVMILTLVEVFAEIPAGSNASIALTTARTMFGTIGISAGTYFFGSSMSSAKKTAALAASAPAALK